MARIWLLLAIFLYPMLLHGQELLYFNFSIPTNREKAVIVSEDIEPCSITRTPNLSIATGSLADLGYSTSGWDTAASADYSKYVEFTVTPKTEIKMNIQRIRFFHFSSDITATTGPTKVLLEVRMGGDTVKTFKFTASKTRKAEDYTLGLNEISEPVTFRFYAYDANELGGYWSLSGFDEKSLIVFGTSEPLPVELTSFTAGISGRQIELKWETATETNNYGFELEKRRGAGEWKSLQFINGHGNSNSAKHYSYRDTDAAAPNIYYYRLKQIDNDGWWEYSNEIEVNYFMPDQPVLGQNYPNPFNPTTYIDYSLPEAGHVIIRIYNVLGEEAAVLERGMKEAGVHAVQFSGKHLNSGLYIYEMEFTGISGKKFSEQKKMTLLK